MNADQILKILYSPPMWFLAILVTILIMAKTKGIFYRLPQNAAPETQIIHQLERFLTIVLGFCTLERVYATFIRAGPSADISHFYILLAVFITVTLLSIIACLIAARISRQ